MSLDANGKTARFGFQTIGGSVVIEPDQYNALLEAVDDSLPASPNAASAFTLTAGVAAAPAGSVGVQQLRLTVTALRVLVTDALAYGGTQLLVWPNSNLVVVDARMNLMGTKDGTGIIAAATPNVSVGSAAASNATLSAAMIDTVEQVAMAGTLAAAVQKNGPHTPGPRQIAAGATNKLWLNAAVNPASDGYIDFTGTIDIFYQDFGTFG